MHIGLRARTVLLALGLVLSHVWMHEFFPNYYPPNPLSRAYLTLSVVDDGTFQIDAWRERFSDIQDKAEFDGHFYSDKAPGYSLLLVPLATVLRAAWLPLPEFISMAVWLRILGLSVPVVVFWLLVRPYYGSLAADSRLGDAVVIAGAFGTSFFIYATQLFSHAMAGVILFASFRLLASRARTSERAAPVVGCVAAGVLAGLAFTVDYVVLLAVPSLCAAAWATGERRPSDLGRFALGCALPIAGWMAYNVACFGHPLRVGFHLHADPVYGEPYRHGFLGIQTPDWSDLSLVTVSPARGLFFLSPVLLLGIGGFVSLWRIRERRYDAIACGAVVTALVAFAATTVDPGGGWSVASRYLVPAIPFLLAGVAAFVRGGGRCRIVAFVGLSLVGIALVAMIALTFPAFPWELENPVYQLSWPLLRAGRLGTSHFSSLFGAAAPMLFVLLFVAAGASQLVVAWRAGGVGGALVAVTVGVLVIGLQASIPESADAAHWQRIGLAYVGDLMGYEPGESDAR